MLVRPVAAAHVIRLRGRPRAPTGNGTQIPQTEKQSPQRILKKKKNLRQLLFNLRQPAIKCSSVLWRPLT
jgi:hypothetical protein